MRKKKDKNFDWVVVVTCQGNPYYYKYNYLFTALIGYAHLYLKYNKYGTMNFVLRQEFYWIGKSNLNYRNV